MTTSDKIKNIIKDYPEKELQILDNMCYGKSLKSRLEIVTLFDTVKKSSSHFGWKRILKQLDKRYEPSLKEQYVRWMFGDAPHPFGEDID